MHKQNILSEYFCEQYNIDIEKDYIIEDVEASSLIIPERIDLVAKLKYIEYFDKQYDLTYIKELYAAHIEAFSSGTFTEPGNEEKNSINKYFETFNNLIASLRIKGMNKEVSVIPVGSNNAIMDGAHRVAIAAYYNLKIPIIRFDHISVNYDADFFERKLLDQRYIDFLVTEYCKIKKKIYFACVWPVANRMEKGQEIKKNFNSVSHIIYEKKINLNHEGLRNFMIQIYSTQEWIGSFKNHFVGVYDKVNSCFDGNGDFSVYVLEGGELDQIIEMKAKIRSLFNLGNHSIHITDNYAEAIQLSNLLLNNNSIEFLNNGKPDYFSNFNKRINLFKHNLVENSLKPEDFLIDSSSTMSLYGLREAADIDFVSVSPNYKLIERSDVSNHHSYINLYETSLDDLVLNPENYFIYNDLKFVTLKMLRKFKKNRNEKKDSFDLKLIENYFQGQKGSLIEMIKIRMLLKRKIRNIKTFTRIFLIKFLKKVKMYELIKKIYILTREK